MPTASFPGYFTSLPKISEFIKEIATNAGMDDAKVYQIRLAVDEAFTNIIEHAYGGEGKGDIDLSIEPIKEGIKIIIRDQGESFDPDTIPQPECDVSIDELKTRGAGLYLIHQLMDKVNFESDASKGNVLTMFKRW